MGDLLQPWHLVVLGVVAFLLFGAKRLPELGKGLGEGLKGFKEGIKGVTDPAPAPPLCSRTRLPSSRYNMLRPRRLRRRSSSKSFAKTSGLGSGLIPCLNGSSCCCFDL